MSAITKLVFIMLLSSAMEFGSCQETTTTSHPVEFLEPQSNRGRGPISSVVYHAPANESIHDANLEVQETRPHGKRQQYSYSQTQRPVSYNEEYNSPPYYYESNNPPQSYHHEYHSPPQSYSVNYNERPRNQHHSYSSPPSHHQSSYNNHDSNDHHEGDDRSYGHGHGGGGDNDHYGHDDGGYGGGDNDYHGGGDEGGDSGGDYHHGGGGGGGGDEGGHDDYEHSPSNHQQTRGNGNRARFNLEY